MITKDRLEEIVEIGYSNGNYEVEYYYCREYNSGNPEFARVTIKKKETSRKPNEFNFDYFGPKKLKKECDKLKSLFFRFNNYYGYAFRVSIKNNYSLQIFVYQRFFNVGALDKFLEGQYAMKNSVKFTTDENTESVTIDFIRKINQDEFSAKLQNFNHQRFSGLLKCEFTINNTPRGRVKSTVTITETMDD